MESMKDGGQMAINSIFIILKMMKVLAHINNGMQMENFFTLKNFRTGLEHGEQKAWDQNGELMYKYIYNDGRRYGIQGSIICNGGNEMGALN